MTTATLPYISSKTTLPTKQSIVRKWHAVDAKDQVLGRLASRIASLLMGKGKTIYTHSVDCGDFVIATNAGQVKLTGNKLNDKYHFHHTSHPGGGRNVPYKKLQKEKPERMLFLAVKRMLPKNRMASRQILRFKIYRSDTHPHAVQQPETIKL